MIFRYFSLWLFFIAIFLLAVSPRLTFAAASGYVPTATVTPGVTSTAIKTYISKLYFAPTDALARVYPSIANGARIGVSSVGAVASSVYSGSAAVASKMLVPLVSGANVSINMIGNIPKSNLAGAALTILKNPYLGVAVLAGTALYNYYQSAGVSLDANGNIKLSPVIGSSTIYDGQVAGMSWTNPANTFRYITHLPSYSDTDQCPLGWVIDHDYLNPAYSPGNGAFPFMKVCKQSIPANSPPPISTIGTDSQANARLISVTPSNIPGVLSDIVQNGQTPDTDTPILTVDPVPSSTVSKTNPDNSSETKVTGYTPTITGDTVAVAENITTTTRNPTGTVTGVTTETRPPLVATTAGTIPASDTPVSQFDDSRIVAAINAAKVQAHDDIVAEPEQIAQKMLNDNPLTPPIPPTITPDTNQYFNFLNTNNPYSFNISSFLPDLPSSNCTYEIHRTIFGRPFDFAPCEKLQPLRVVFAWAFSVLTLWSCFLVIFRSSF